MHQVNPGPALAAALQHPAMPLRIAAMQTVGALGRTDLLAALAPALGDAEPEVAFQAARAACLLGERHASLRVLAALAQRDSAWASQALALALAALPFSEAGALARQASAAAPTAGPSTAPTSTRPPPANPLPRHRVRTLGWLGDVRFVPWLIERMAEPALARLAGESFSLITGADLAALQLETLRAPPLPEQPSDDPADADVALDEDDSLPWPDAGRVQRWWAQAGPAMAAAAGAGPLFMGQPVGLAALQQALAQGNQRQRALAALRLGLLQPGRPLFAVAAPTPRQRRWLQTTPPA